MCVSKLLYWHGRCHHHYHLPSVFFIYFIFITFLTRRFYYGTGITLRWSRFIYVVFLVTVLAHFLNELHILFSGFQYFIIRKLDFNEYVWYYNSTRTKVDATRFNRKQWLKFNDDNFFFLMIILIKNCQSTYISFEIINKRKLNKSNETLTFHLKNKRYAQLKRLDRMNYYHKCVDARFIKRAI